MSKSKRIPIQAAIDVANNYNKTQVIIVTWDDTGTTWVTTYGKSLKDSEQAAIGGNFVKKALGFPEEDCNSMPARVKRSKEKVIKRPTSERPQPKNSNGKI